MPCARRARPRHAEHDDPRGRAPRPALRHRIGRRLRRGRRARSGLRRRARGAGDRAGACAARQHADGRAQPRRRRVSGAKRLRPRRARPRDVPARDSGVRGSGNRTGGVRPRRAVRVLLGAVPVFGNGRRAQRKPRPLRSAVPDALPDGGRGRLSALDKGSLRARRAGRSARSRRRQLQDRGPAEAPRIRRRRHRRLSRRDRPARRAARRAAASADVQSRRLHAGVSPRRGRFGADVRRAAKPPRRQDRRRGAGRLDPAGRRRRSGGRAGAPRDSAGRAGNRRARRSGRKSGGAPARRAPLPPSCAGSSWEGGFFRRRPAGPAVRFRGRFRPLPRRAARRPADPPGLRSPDARSAGKRLGRTPGNFHPRRTDAARRPASRTRNLGRHARRSSCRPGRRSRAQPGIRPRARRSAAAQDRRDALSDD